jgi:hypothetical protein
MHRPTFHRVIRFGLLAFAQGCSGSNAVQGPAESVADAASESSVSNVDGPIADSGPMQEAQIDSPPSGLQISVAIAAAHLGAEGCAHDESGGLGLLSCAILPDASPHGSGLCGGPCELTQVQLGFSSGSTGSPAHVQIASVALLDGMTGTTLQTLSAYSPMVWNASQYVAWDETVPASAQLRVNYTIAPPMWSTFDPSHIYSYPYMLRLVIQVDGASITLESTALTRPPPIAT